MWYRSLSYRQKGRLDHLLQTQLHPKTVVRVLEALVDDHGLTRAESNGMMELVFERMKHDGTWR
jgi:hypothetical protein